jgi:ABC-type spermidine/putrescine transport system permease subunit I
MRRPGQAATLLLPVFLVIVPLILGPLFVLGDESLKPYIPGRIGGARDAGLTFTNYTAILDRDYLRYFLDTFRIGLIVTVLALILGYPMAHLVARTGSRTLRRILLAALIGTLFLSLIVRIYAIALTFGSLGPLSGFGALIGVPTGSPSDAEFMVVLGLLHTTLPLVTLTLIGTIQNIDPKLEDAAMSLGAPHWRAFASITFPMSLPGILSAGIIGYAFCISNLVVPMLLGRGFVVFVANLIYFRFSEVANFPSGAAISIIMMAISLGVFFGLLSLVRMRWTEAGK